MQHLCYVTNSIRYVTFSMQYLCHITNTGTDLFAAFALAFTFAPMEAPQYVYMLFFIFLSHLHSHATYRLSGILALLMLLQVPLQYKMRMCHTF